MKKIYIKSTDKVNKKSKWYIFYHMRAIKNSAKITQNEMLFETVRMTYR